MSRTNRVRRMLAFGGLVALLGAVAGGARAATPEGPRLALQKLDRRGSRLEIETVDRTGGRRQVIAGGPRRTSRPLPEFGFAPAWSPDGRLLAFGGHTGEGTRIFLVEADGGRPRAVPGTRGAFAPVFAPDGRAIAFARARVRAHIGIPEHGPPIISSYASVTTWTIGVDGGDSRRLTPWRNGLEIVPSSFSPDGTVLAASRFDEDSLSFDAVALRGDGTDGTILAADASRPSFSPDGSRIALIGHLSHLQPGSGRYGSYRGALTVMAADGSERRRLARTSFLEQSPPSWDPSGERLAYTEGTSVVEINADGTCRTKVFAGTARLFYFGPVWQPGAGREAGPIECG